MSGNSIGQTEQASLLSSETATKSKLSASTISDYISLAKPNILSLLLISTGCPMILAAGTTPNLSLVFWTLVGGALMSGSAAAVNCVWEKKTDRLMERTKNRPVAAGRISQINGVIFAFIIGSIALSILALLVNPLAAAMALAGHFFYVFVYTIWLKPSTPQNIVIGGAAGAVPPLVGWAAVTGEINLTAILLFLVIFLWTPPHFWALALNKNKDYQRAGIPMLPVVAGERVTHVQMLAYALALIPVSLLLVFSDPNLGRFSFFSFLALSGIFAWKCYELKVLGEEGSDQREKKAWEVFRFSLYYLGLFFLLIVLDTLVF